jgi:hypothetical protein
MPLLFFFSYSIIYVGTKIVQTESKSKKATLFCIILVSAHGKLAYKCAMADIIGKIEDFAFAEV